MEKMKMYKLVVIMKSGRTYKIKATSQELDWLFDIMYGREKGEFQFIGDCVVNVNEIEYLYYKEVEND